MKNLLFTLLSLFILFSFDSCKKEDETPVDKTKRISQYFRHDSLSTYVFPIKLFYDDDKIGLLESEIYENQIIKTKFYYKDGKIDYYDGFIYPGMMHFDIGKGSLSSKYFYLANGLLDSIKFNYSKKDDYIEYIKLGYDSDKRINSYAIVHNIDPSTYYKYDWNDDDIEKEEIYSHWNNFTPDKVIYYKRYFEYLDKNNSLNALNALYFESKYLNKHLVKSEKQIRYYYTVDYSNNTRVLKGTDTTTVNYHYEFSGDLVWKTYRGDELMDVILYE